MRDGWTSRKKSLPPPSLPHEALAAGNLEQTRQCRCVIHVSGETISILLAEPQVVCAPV
jgi:hypothetical protein